MLRRRPSPHHLHNPPVLRRRILAVRVLLPPELPVSVGQYNYTSGLACSLTFARRHAAHP